MEGYLHQNYALSFSDFSTPRVLPRCGGWILERETPKLPYQDAMGCYPLFLCRDWANLGSDVEGLSDDLVSLALVTDPFGEYTNNDLMRCFDKVVRYKEHFVTDLEDPSSRVATGKHRRNIATALRQIELEICPRPGDYLNEWVDLYSHLVCRHNISGLLSFSRYCFEKQLSLPGLVMFRAANKGRTVGLHLWVVTGNVAYGHLGATNEMGYKLMASYALYWFALETFRGSIRWLDIGASPGGAHPTDQGLARFKRGWATGTRPVYFCARIFDQEKYHLLVTAANIGQTDYFPAYRAGEF